MLSSIYGITGKAIQWFKSYLSNRTFRVKVQNIFSKHRSFDCGVPQGSILGPILFLLYTKPIGDIIRDHNLNFHLYADDTQLYITFSTSSLSESESAIRAVEDCVADLNKWMTDNMLKLNSDKTEILVLSSKHIPRPLISSLNISGYDISPSQTARNIGVIFDNELSLDDHITSVCKSCFFHIYNIWKIRKFLSQSACEILVHALISSKLDFCNSLLYGLPKTSLKRLQCVQNAAARLVSLTKKQEHITPILFNLHWLPIEQRIEFKIILLTFKILNGKAPSYLSNLISCYVPSRPLRSSSSNLLSIQSNKLKAYGKRAFSFASPHLWNSLPAEMRTCKTFSNFKSNLKTFLFKKAFYIE